MIAGGLPHILTGLQKTESCFTAHAATSDGQTRDSLPVFSDMRSVHSGWFLLGLQKMFVCECVKFWNHLLSVDNLYIRYTASTI